MNIFLSKSASRVLRAVSQEVRRRKGAGADYRNQLDFCEGLEAHKLLVPDMPEVEYRQAVNELFGFGLLWRTYMYGGFLLSNKGIDFALHPVRFFLLANRSELLSVLAVIISIISLAVSLAT